MENRLESARLILRAVRLSDAPTLSALSGDYAVASMTASLPYPNPLLSTEFWIMQSRNNDARGRSYTYAITPKSEDLAMGVVSLGRTSDDQWEIGYWLGRRFWDQGFMSEAAACVLRAADSALGAVVIEAGHFTENAASKRILEKLGFKASGDPQSRFCMARLKTVQSLRYERASNTANAMPRPAPAREHLGRLAS